MKISIVSLALSLVVTIGCGSPSDGTVDERSVDGPAAAGKSGGSSVAGQAGQSGSSGQAGQGTFAGAAGAAGSDAGAAGTSGAAGNSGVSGSAGSAGTSGSSGQAGAGGNAGAAAGQAGAAGSTAECALDADCPNTPGVCQSIVCQSGSCMAGPDLCSQAGVLQFDLSAATVSSIYVKKQQNLTAIKITISNPGNMGKTLHSLTLQGQAQTPGCAFSFEAECSKQLFSSRVTGLAVYDGSMVIGLPKSPNALGQAKIDNMALHLAPGESKQLTVKMSLSSTASTDMPYDKVAVGLGFEVDATNDNGLPAYWEQSDALLKQLKAAPVIAHTILPHGELEIAIDPKPQAIPVYANSKTWMPVAQYRGIAKFEGAEINRLAVRLVPPASSWPMDTVLAVAAEGTILGFTVPPSSDFVDVDLSTTPILIEANTVAQFQLWVEMQDQTPVIEIASDITVGEWSPSFLGKYNARSVGNSSGEYLFAAKP